MILIVLLVGSNVGWLIYNSQFEIVEETKTETSNKDQRFKKLFKEIKNHKEISLLQKVLTYLCENKYQSDVEEIKKF